MVKELELYGATAFPRVGPIEDDVWDFLANRNRYGSMGRRVSNARCGARLRAAIKHRPFWTVQLWERCFVALEHDYLRSRSSAKRPQVSAGDSGAA
eukprot:736754-Pyramimonas_sp.AAC.1